MRVRRSRLALAVLCALLPVAPLMAQQRAPEGAVDPATLGTVLVRGEKTERSLQETAASVAVTTSVRIEQENLRSLADVLERTPNVAESYGARDFTIRGIGNAGGEVNPLATIYLDGAALATQVTGNGPTELWDVAQVELFRGPQSTIQGQNALAGAIVIRTEDPTFDWNGRARVLLSDPSDRRVAFAGGGPLIADELAFRVAVEDRNFDGFTRNITRNTGEDAAESTLSRATLLWTPAAIEGLRVRLSYTHDEREGPYMYAYARSDVPDYYDNRINTSDHPNTTRARTDVGTLEIDYAFSDAWSLSAVSGWSDALMRRSYDNDNSPVPEQYGSTHEPYKVLSQEFRLHYAGDALRGLVGLYGARRSYDRSQISNIRIATPVATIAGVLQGAGLPAANANAIAGMYAAALPSIPVAYDARNTGESENLALFADGEYRFNDTWAAIAGFRYDRETYGFESLTEAGFTGTLPDPAAFGSALVPAITGINNAVLGMVAQAGARTPWNDSEFTAFLPKAGLRWSWHADRSLAFTAQRAYRSGGTSYNVARSQPFAYDPEYTLNYELALRTQWLDGRLQFNANAYYIDWKDKQTYVYFGLNSYDYHVVNAGKAHLYGLEAELRHRVTAAFDWYGAVGWSRTRYDEFTLAAGALQTDYAGSEFAYAPRWTAALGGNLRWSEGWFANANVNFRDRVNVDVGAGNNVLSSRTLLNAKLGYENLDWSTYVFGSNLLDRGYTQYAWLDDPNVTLGAPRVVGIGFEYHW
ncbi:TonB-dependent receptor [Xanthomonas sp. XNM01]|uniref:TonB-dependent receptor n=1 Tax=Xanthomonas sp. XNM01 TaxID=2769289 RepID=UPI001CE05A34|nr:TonB-dependent receptor [Xanthomonas sp. XNM01]